MIVFIAGAAGAIRRPLVQQLVSAGHGWSAQLDPRRSSDTSAPRRCFRRRRAPATAMLYDARSSQHRPCRHRPAHRPGTTERDRSVQPLAESPGV